MTTIPMVTFEAGTQGRSLWSDQAPIISGTGFIPVTEVRLKTACLDGSGREWLSENGYLVSAGTTFNTALTAAVGDDYYGIAAEGPIYSMRCADGTGHDFVLPLEGVLELRYQLLDGGRPMWSGTAHRTTHQEPSGGGEKVALLHNSTPGVDHGLALLRSAGHDVSAFAVQSDEPELDPLLQALEESGCRHMIASGRASEAALELAQRLPQLKSVSIFSGSALRFSPWRIEGRPLPFVACDHSTLQPRGRTVLSTRTVYAEAVADRDNRNQGRIEVEKIACPLYLFSGSDDQIWPSAAFSELASQRRTAHGLESITLHKTFPSVGYDLGPELGLPGLPTTERTLSHSVTGFRLALGGKMGRQSRARRECWEELLAILAV